MANTFTDFTHLKIPLEVVVKATNNFDHKNVIGEGDFGKVYKGQLLRNAKLINISARRLDRKNGHGHIEFLNEISALSNLEHKNIVSLIGYCDEKDEKIIINEYNAKGSLFMYLSDPTFTWRQRVKVCRGIADAISYIHDNYGESYYFIHCNINSSTILLDHKWKPKLSGFEYSIKHPQDRKSKVFLCDAIRTAGYEDPAIKKTGGVTYKSDIYTFGVVMFELLCGRKAFIPNENNELLAPLAKVHFENETLKDIVDKDLWNGMTQFTYNSESFSAFAEAAYSCLEEERAARPDAGHLWCDLEFACNETVQSISGSSISDSSMSGSSISGSSNFRFIKSQEMEMEEHSQDEYQSTSEEVSDTRIRTELNEKFGDTLEIISGNYSEKVKKFDHLRIRLEHIMLATDNFSKNIYYENGTSLASLTHVYITELECFDKMYLPLIEGKNTGELPKKEYTVIIRRHRFEEHMLQNVIETLTKCEHRNIESFLGFCDEGPETFLVFEFVSHDFLDNYLEDRTLTWKKRLEICIDIAHALDYLHSKMQDQKRVIHSHMGTWTVVLNDNCQAMIVGLEKGIFLSPNQDDGAFYQDDGAIYQREKFFYTDPEYAKTGKLTIKSVVYKFGALMLEILCGQSIEYCIKYSCKSSEEKVLEYKASILAMFDNGRTKEKVLEYVASIRAMFDQGIIKENVLPTIMEENVENNSFLKKGPNEDSLEIFLKVAYQCLAETPNERPSMETVVKELKKALSCQENHKDPFRMPIEDIELATKDFCKENFVGGGGFGRVYKGEVAHGLENGNRIIVAKRLDTRGGQGEKEFYNELQILSECKHENVIGLVGYSNEKHERVIVYEYAPRGSLEKYLNDDKLSWRIRLQICIDVASGLAFLHGGVQGKEVVIHRDIKAANILLFDDWKAKVADFGLSLISTINENTNYTIDHVCGTPGYLDPVYAKSGFLTIESDIYSFGVVLFEIMYGRSTYEIYKQKGQFLPNFVRLMFKENKQDELVFEAIKEHTVPKSLTTFQTIAYKCIHENREKRPTSKEVLEQLKMALEFQVQTASKGSVSLGRKCNEDDAWTLVIGKRNKHLRNHLQVNKEKITTVNTNTNNTVTFYFTNFPSNCDHFDMKAVFAKYGKVGDVSIARKLNVHGKRFGFARFNGVVNPTAFEKELNTICIGTQTLRCNVARY